MCEVGLGELRSKQRSPGTGVHAGKPGSGFFHTNELTNRNVVFAVCVFFFFFLF